MFSSSEYRDSQDLQSSRPFLSSASRLELGEEDDQEQTFNPKRQSRVVSFFRSNAKAIASTLVLTGVAYFAGRASSSRLPKLGLSVSGTTAQSSTTDSSSVLVVTNGTATFRENLLPSTKYVTAFLSAGFTNQFMEMTSLIYLSLLTNRVPIIPAFLPDHFGSLANAVPTNFGDIFDTPYLANQLGVPIVEWHELKRPTYAPPGGPVPVPEELGCWSLTAGNQISGGRPTVSNSIPLYELNVSWTPVPSTFTLTHGADPQTYMWSMWGLASLGFPKSRARVLPGELPKTVPLNDGSGKKLEPDEQLLCFDLLYFTGVMEPYPANDFFTDYSPFWNQVGVHMRWKQSLVEIANQYLRRHFGVQNSTDPIPPFISVHVRHTDFAAICSGGMNKEDCFAPVSAYEKRVNEVKERLKTRKNGVDVRAVIVTSDERDSKWWDQVAALGNDWSWIDHNTEKTAERYGNWFPLLLDAMFQSMGKGFVGTLGSTMSDLARKRVEDWHDGESAMVHWGAPGADNH